MVDVIQLLPDAVANQIAAGEVIQRPASIVKELIENALDAGATDIKLIIKDAGKTLVQVIDNGSGMSETDARMAFERHATSKISQAADLFALRTMGFRGEALASIAAIAELELKTRRNNDDLGTFLHISASEVLNQTPVNCPVGSNFAVKNLFFNIPARRKFLKTNSTELKHIYSEFHRTALANPEIAFSLKQNDSLVYNLKSGNYKQRILSLFGKNTSQNLVKLKTETSLVNMYGYIGKPEFARKTGGEQFFFVNKRYMRHSYFHKAILMAYEKLLPPDTVPAYFIYFEIDPQEIDVNIHPTKTEIKFSDAVSVFRILRVAIKEALGKFNIIPSIDFGEQSDILIPSMPQDEQVEPPSIEINTSYNPFQTGGSPPEKQSVENWESLYEQENYSFENRQESLPSDFNSKSQNAVNQVDSIKHFQLKRKYILTQVKSGLMLVNQKRAHERILFEQFSQILRSNTAAVAQQNLFPSQLPLNEIDYLIFQEISAEIQSLGFDVSDLGGHTIAINALPAYIEQEPVSFFESLIESYRNQQQALDIQQDVKSTLALSMAKAAAINYGQALNMQEMEELIASLFSCENHNYSPSGKKIIHIVTISEMDKFFA